MPARSPSARRYAEAIFEIASESESFEQWSRDLRTIADFAAEPDVAQVLESSRVPRDAKLRLVEAGLSDRITSLAMNLVRILAERGKLHLVRDVQLIFQEKLDEKLGIAHAVVTTAVPLTDAERDAVAQRLSSITGKDVDVTPVVDERILGGLIARIGDQLIDGSTRTKLLSLQRRLASASRK